MSIATCLLKLAKDISPFDNSVITDASKVYQSRGKKEDEANVAAIRDHLAELRTERADIEAKVLAEWEKRRPKPVAPPPAPVVQKAATPPAPVVQKPAPAPKSDFRYSIRESAIDATVARLPEPVRAYSKSWATTLNDLMQRGIQGISFGHDLAVQIEGLLTSAKRYFDLMGSKGASKLKLEAGIDAIMERASAVKDQVAMNLFLNKSTREGKWGYVPQWHKGKDTITVDDTMKGQYRLLSDEARAVVDQVFEYGYDNINRLNTLVKSEIENAWAEEANNPNFTEEAKKKIEQRKQRSMRLFEKTFKMANGPYAPLSRFGNYIATGESAEMTAAKKDKDEKRIEELQSNPAHYVVSFHDTLGAAEMQAGLYKTEGFTYTGHFAKEDFYSSIHETPWSSMRRFRSMLESEADDSGMPDKSKKQITRFLNDLYFSTLAEGSARQFQNRRRLVRGEEEDMMRAFASKGRADAHFIASLEHNGEINDIIGVMRKEAQERDGKRADRVRALNEVLARHAASLDYTPTPIQDKLAAVTSFWLLVTNPAYYIQNSLQPFMLTLPWLAGRFGYVRSFTAFNKAYDDILKGRLNVDKMPISATEKAMLEQLRNTGILDVGINRDLGYWESGGGTVSSGIAKVNHFFSKQIQKMEMLNRVASALAAYRLAGGGLVGSERAAEALRVTHGDYSAFNTPRFFNIPGSKLILQFRKFQVIQLSMLARLLKTSFAGATPAERAIARKAFAILLTHNAVFAGSLGLPMANWIMPMIGMALKETGDPDDDEYLIRRAIGDKALADLLLMGVPGALGLDLSKKLGMGNATALLPFVDKSIFEKDGYSAHVLGLAGPFVGGLAPRVVNGVGLWLKGDPWKGTEMMLPSGISNGMRAYRTATEGVTKLSGDTVIHPDEISGFAAALQALGLPVLQVTERSRRQGELTNITDHFVAEAEAIKFRYAKASKAGDSAGIASARREWEQLQVAKARNGIRAAPMGELLRAATMQVQREGKVVDGLQFRNTNRGLVEGIASR